MPVSHSGPIPELSVGKVPTAVVAEALRTQVSMMKAVDFPRLAKEAAGAPILGPPPLVIGHRCPECQSYPLTTPHKVPAAPRSRKRLA